MNYAIVEHPFEAPAISEDIDAARANLADDCTAAEVRKELLDFSSLLRGFVMNDPARTLSDGGWTLDQVIEQIEDMAGGVG